MFLYIAGHRFARPRQLSIMPGLLAALTGLLLSINARAASVADIDADIEKANQILKNAGSESRASASERASVLTTAIETLHSTMELIEKSPELSSEEREKKSSEVLSTIFWCKKMMPLDLSGRTLAAKPVTSGSNDHSGNNLQESTTVQPGASAKSEPAIQLDEMAFNRAKTYAVAHPNDLESNITWFESVAFYFPQSKWGERAGEEARQARAKLSAIREPLHETTTKLRRLELVEALDALSGKSVTEPTEAKRIQMAQLIKDIKNLQAVQQQLVNNLRDRQTPLDISFEELGLSTKGWLRQVAADGITYSHERDGTLGPTMTWNEFGAKAMILLAKKVLSPDGATLEHLAVAATTIEEYGIAQELFSRLLTTDPQRVKSVATYFDRAQTGYQNSAQGGAQAKFAAVKTLFRERKFVEGMSELNELQQNLAANSSLQATLKEVDHYRSSVRRQFQIDNTGQPITAFERSIRGVFGGDVKIDEATGVIEASYDFTNADQLRDWSVMDYYGKNSTKPDWRPGSGGLTCSGMNTILVWKFPVSEFSITADITYLDSTHRVVIYSCMSKENSGGIWAWCRDGEARIGRGKLSEYGWHTSSRFIWRTGETASVAFNFDLNSAYPFDLQVNGQYGVSGRYSGSRGAIGFSFDGGRGTINNVRIKGVLDPDQLKQLTAMK